MLIFRCASFGKLATTKRPDDESLNTQSNINIIGEWERIGVPLICCELDICSYFMTVFGSVKSNKSIKRCKCYDWDYRGSTLKCNWLVLLAILYDTIGRMDETVVKLPTTMVVSKYIQIVQRASPLNWFFFIGKCKFMSL